MSDVPLPEPWSYCYVFETETSRHLSFSANKYNGMPPTEAVPIYTKNQLHAHAAAVSAALAAENARLREALETIAKSSPDEFGCYYTNRRNIGIAIAALKGQP